MESSILFIITSVALGLVLMGVSLAVFLMKENPSKGLEWVVSGIFAMGAAFASAGLIGSLSFSNGVWVAGGGFAVLLLFVLFSPFKGVKKLIEIKDSKE